MAIEIHPAASSSVSSSHPESLPSDANPNIHCPPSSRIKLKGGADAHQSQLSYSILGLFLFYIGHDALQERMFRLDGFQYGFFMTLIEVVVMLLASMIVNEESSGSTPSSSSSRKGKKKYTTTGTILTSTTTITTKPPLSTATIVRIAWVGLLLALAHGLGNSSLNYSPYPLKVAFKSCKLVPTMAVGACFTYDRRYTALQYTAALVMGMGLAILSSADTTNTSVIHSNEEGSSSRILVADEDAASSHDINNLIASSSASSSWHDTIIPYLGPLLLTISTGLDSAVPNIQEQLLRSKRVQTTDMIRISNGVMCACLAVYTYFSGEFHLAWIYCTKRVDASFMLLLQGICAYFGLRCYLSIIRECGGVMGVLLANARKVITIVLSFVLFSKPFNERHVVGLTIVGIGVYLGCISKKEKKGGKKEIDKDNIMIATVGERDDLTLSNGGDENNNRHEHSV